MHNDLYVLIDIGGTAIKHGIATLDGNLQERAELPTEAQEFGGLGIVQKVKKICSDALSKYGSQIKGVSISTAARVLKKLVKNNLLKQNGKGRGTNYIPL